jgi:adenylylsulfate kinase
MAKVFWFTGLSGSGKSTLGNELARHIPAIVLDGDVVRTGLNSDLSFSLEDRDENIRRIAEVSKIIWQSGINVITCFISPLRKSRQFARSLIGSGFVEISLTTALGVCEGRDVRGNYKKARAGIIKDYTGIGSPYEFALKPELELDTERLSVTECIRRILEKTQTVSTLKPHDAFVGRWCPFHKGHWAVMEKVYKQNNRPLLILVRDTSFDEYSAQTRCEMVQESMKVMGIPASVIVIPDIKSVNWGRGVGYETNLIEVAEDIQGISATEIRARLKASDESWKDLVAPGVANFIERNGLYL